MSYNDSADDQSEDGELRQSPVENRRKQEIMDFSLSEEEGEATDSLDIKPPQARAIQSSSRNKRKENKSHHKRSERHKDDRHRDKRHKEKQVRSKESYHREKARFYREQAMYKDNYMDAQYSEKQYREHSSRHSEFRKKERYVRELEKHRHERDKYDEKWDKSAGDKALEDLRERLLSKRTSGKSDDDFKSEKSERNRAKDDNMDVVLQGEAGMYVKEIINISTSEERKYRKESREEEKLTEEERVEQEMRREKLLEAGKTKENWYNLPRKFVAEREMARQKEQLRLERERRHLVRQTKRRFEDDEGFAKRLHLSDAVVTVSDNSEVEEEEEERHEEVESYRSEKSESSNPSMHSSHSSPTPSPSSVSASERKSPTPSPVRDRSASTSPKDNGITEEKQETEVEVKPEEINEDLPPYYPAIQGCRSVEEFQCLNRIEEGTYGVVYRARDKRTEEIVALKRLKMEKEKEGFPITSLREINTLLKGQHPNIVTVREIVVGSNMDKIFIVMDYVEHDLKSLIETMRHKKQTFTPGEIKCLLRQLLRAVAHLHDNWILHRDLKTSNLLLSHKGVLKVGDFGLAREYGSPLKAYTPVVVTLWYRAPELLLCSKEYSTPIDVWSVGCIFGELLLMNAIFPGKNELDQMNRVFKDLGTPNEKVWPGYSKLPAVQKIKFSEYPISNLRNRFHMLSESGQALLHKFLTYDPTQRITAEDAVTHPYFDETPLPIDPSMFPTWPAKSELGHRRALAASPKPPSGGREYKQLGGDADDESLGFRISASVMENRRLPMGGGFSLKF